nr:hypothetical protein [Tanacetum cinerariifolium]
HTAFSGNFELCDKPLTKTCNKTKYPPSSSSSPSDSLSSDDKKKKKKLSTGHIVAIAVGSAFILLIPSLCLGKKWNRPIKDKKAQGVATMAALDGKKAREPGTSS